MTVDEVLKGEKMGPKFLGREPLEVTLLHMDWTCPCPNVTVGEMPLIIMGEVDGGMGHAAFRQLRGEPRSTRRARSCVMSCDKKTLSVQGLPRFAVKPLCLSPALFLILFYLPIPCDPQSANWARSD